MSDQPRLEAMFEEINQITLAEVRKESALVGLCPCGHTQAQHLKQKYYVGKCMVPHCPCEEYREPRKRR